MIAFADNALAEGLQTKVDYPCSVTLAECHW